MKDSTEERIRRRGPGTPVNYPPEVVGEVTWLPYNVGDEEFIWRPQDTTLDLEVGRRGKQAVFYAKVGPVITDRAFAKRRDAMRFAKAEHDAINAIT